MRSLDQIRAAHAYGVMETASQDLRDLASELPAMLRTNGLLATWAFCLAKGGHHERCLSDAFLPYLREERLDLQVGQGTATAVFRGWVDPPRHLAGPQLRRLTEEATAFAGWLKRAAEAYG